MEHVNYKYEYSEVFSQLSTVPWDKLNVAGEKGWEWFHSITGAQWYCYCLRRKTGIYNSFTMDGDE